MSDSCVIVDGSPELEAVLVEWQRLRAEITNKIERATVMEAQLKAALPSPEEGDALRLGRQVISRGFLGLIHVDKDRPELPWAMRAREKARQERTRIADLASQERDNW